MINGENIIEFRCIEIEQPLGKFYIGSLDHRDLLRITFADVRELEDREFDKYLGIERPLSTGRVAELKKYVNLVDASFPTSVIIAVSSEHADYDSKKNLMRICDDEDIAKIIDGQHRIKGLEGFQGEHFELAVTIFVDMDIDDQATVFSTINLKHTKVSKSLAYDLYEYAKARSPQKTCHNIARLLNIKDGSPFKEKIKTLGTAERATETLTQATFVDRLMKHISKDSMSDRDLLKRRKQPERASEKEAKRLIFRNLFLDKEDAVIARTVWNYFAAVSAKWPTAWNEVQRGNILNRATGFAALMRFLKPSFIHLPKREGKVISQRAFSGIFERIDLTDGDFNPDQFKPGSTGESELVKQLLGRSGLEA